MSKMPDSIIKVSFPPNPEFARPVQEMLRSALTRKALQFAQSRIKDKMRANPREPVMHHVMRVATIVSDVFHGDGHAIALALLHDVMEDGNASLSKVQRIMGRRLADDVTLLTKPILGSSAIRQRLYLNGLAQASESVKLVKLADFLDNICARRQTQRLRTTTASALRLCEILRRQLLSPPLERALVFVETAAIESLRSMAMTGAIGTNANCRAQTPANAGRER